MAMCGTAQHFPVALLSHRNIGISGVHEAITQSSGPAGDVLYWKAAELLQSCRFIFKNKMQFAKTKPLKEGKGHYLVCRNRVVPKKQAKISGKFFKPNIHNVLILPHYCS